MEGSTGNTSDVAIAEVVVGVGSAERLSSVLAVKGMATVPEMRSV